jgi:hypothetical protein
LWKRPPHLGTNSAHSPGFLPALGRDHALRSELPANTTSACVALAAVFARGAATGRRSLSRH